jgi:hypothetical protein
MPYTTSRKAQRQKTNADTRGPGNIIDRVYNEAAGANKQLPILGYLVPKGAASPAIEAQAKGQTFAFFNSDTAVHFVAMGLGPTAPVAPSSPANGIAIPPMSYVTLAMKDNLWFVSDSALVFAYWVDDETYWD